MHELFPLVRVAFVEGSATEFVDDGLGSAVDFTGEVFFPSASRPDEPSAQLGNPFEISPVTSDESAGVAKIGEWVLDLLLYQAGGFGVDVALLGGHPHLVFLGDVIGVRQSKIV